MGTYLAPGFEGVVSKGRALGEFFTNKALELLSNFVGTRKDNHDLAYGHVEEIHSPSPDGPLVSCFLFHSYKLFLYIIA